MIVKNITNSIIPLQFDVLEYVASDDIYGFTSKFARDVYFTNGLYEIDDEVINPSNSHDIRIFFKPIMTSYTRYPENLVFAVARIGGLLGFLKLLSLLLFFLHQHLFMRLLSKN